MIEISYSVHKFYKVTGTDNYKVADEEFLRAYKGNFLTDSATLDRVLISRVTEVDGVVTESTVSIDDSCNWVT